MQMTAIPAIASSAQPWLQEIYRNPERYEGRIVALVDSERILTVGKDFDEAIERATSLGATGRITYFSVPRHVGRLQILTLRLRSLREDVWSPIYPVVLKSQHGTLMAEMLVDSGADISLISKSAGATLGLLRSEEEDMLTAQGIGGSVSYLMRRITVEIDGFSVSTGVAWCQNEEITDMILGRKDVCDAFNVEFRQSERRVIFTPVPPSTTTKDLA
jgi:hypothetical protein